MLHHLTGDQGFVARPGATQLTQLHANNVDYMHIIMDKVMRLALRLLFVAALFVSISSVFAVWKIASEANETTEIALPVRASLQLFSGAAAQDMKRNERHLSIFGWRKDVITFLVQVKDPYGNTRWLSISGLDADASVIDAQLLSAIKQGKSITALIDDRGEVFDLTIGNEPIFSYDESFRRRLNRRQQGLESAYRAQILAAVSAILGLLTMIASLYALRRRKR